MQKFSVTDARTHAQLKSYIYDDDSNVKVGSIQGALRNPQPPSEHVLTIELGVLNLYLSIGLETCLQYTYTELSSLPAKTKTYVSHQQLNTKQKCEGEWLLC